MDTLLQTIQQHPSPKVRGFATLILMFIGWFGRDITMVDDWMIKILQTVSLGMVVFINWPAMVKRIKTIIKNFKNGHN